MSPEELIKAIEQSGGVLTAFKSGNRLRYQLPANAGLLLDELRRMKSEVISILHRRSFAHLMPFLGKRVWTPDGPARLVELEDYAVVQTEDAKKVRWYDATAVIPYA